MMSRFQSIGSFSSTASSDYKHTFSHKREFVVDQAHMDVCDAAQGGMYILSTNWNSRLEFLTVMTNTLWQVTKGPML